ncbi:hypothetical protein FF011L_36140 [Roseimaritima multifibrata]|uniref:DUF2383 domain-containing protein n=1 Tax=Roseimaritima multifibrata TaxID=1930274 RepID=A0A517MIW5_9BACT|nr:hypothetical protein [Roseimaritima multifibrata]QDS94832.1 hypothetical protein FF011L_36140 [Roseimaritima multifibrata]
MNQPNTIYDVLGMLADYHQQRAERYERLCKASVDPKADILLKHLVELETDSMNVVRDEMQRLPPEHSTYLLSGPRLSSEALHAVECNCKDESSFQEALSCALVSDQRLDELLDRIEDSTAAPSVIELAKRLREVEHMKGRQIAKFTRED